ENLTSRPVGIAMINSSQDSSGLSSALSSSVSSPSLSEQETTPFSITKNQTSDSKSNDTEDNHIQLLIIASPNQINNDSSSNHYSGSSYGANKVTTISYAPSNYSADASDSQNNESTIYRINIFGSAQSQKSNSNDIQNSINNDRSDSYYVDGNTNLDNSSRYENQVQGSSPKVATLLNYPDGQLGKVVVVAVPTYDTNSSSSLAPNSLPNSFGLNDTTAFVINHGSSNSSAQSASTNLPEIMMLDVQNGNFVPFLTRSQINSNFMPVDVAFDYIHNDLYVLSISNNLEGEEGSNNIGDQLSSGTSNNDNSGVIWKISYIGTEGEPIVNSSDSTVDNGTDDSINESNNNETTEETSSELTESSSNDTSLNDSSTETDTTSDSDNFEEDFDDVDDSESVDSSSDDLSSSSSDSDSNNTDTSSEDTSGESDDSSSSSDSTDDSSTASSSDSSSSEDTTDSSSTDDDSSSPSSQPSTEPQNEPPEAEDDSATTDQGTPVVIDVLANDSDKDDGDSLSIDSVDENSIQGGNLKIVSSSSSSSSGSADDDTANSDINNNNNEDDNTSDDNAESNSNAKIQYTPAEGFIGNDEFTYTIIDSAGATDSAKVTVTVSENVIAPQPINYWLENEEGITENTLENAANENENNNDDLSFKLGNFEVPKDFDVSDSENDTKGILEAGQGGSNVNTFDQLAAQLLASKLNIQNAASTCNSVENSIEDADASLRTNQYEGPSSSENLTDDSSESTQNLIESLDNYNNNNGCSSNN
ncbi:MAG TPA: Ig-like domain-containing protein, partial [Nitrososphaera sp.]